MSLEPTPYVCHCGTLYRNGDGRYARCAGECGLGPLFALRPQDRGPVMADADPVAGVCAGEVDRPEPAHWRSALAPLLIGCLAVFVGWASLYGEVLAALLGLPYPY